MECGVNNVTEQEAGPPAAKAGRRQQGITERRRRLVRAAGELIEEKEDGNFSMPELAARAGVSLATPYNLFGSKAAVLGQLFEGQVRGFIKDSDWMQGKPPHERILGVVDRLVAAYSRRPVFFRNLMKAMHALGTVEQSQMPYDGVHLVHPLVSGLAADGYIPEQVPAALLEATLIRLFESTFEHWAIRNWETERLHHELRSSFALVFYGLLGPAERAPLEQAMKLPPTA